MSGKKFKAWRFELKVNPDFTGLPRYSWNVVSGFTDVNTKVINSNYTIMVKSLQYCTCLENSQAKHPHTLKMDNLNSSKLFSGIYSSTPLI